MGVQERGRGGVMLWDVGECRIDAAFVVVVGLVELRRDQFGDIVLGTVGSSVA